MEKAITIKLRFFEFVVSLIVLFLFIPNAFSQSLLNPLADIGVSSKITLGPPKIFTYSYKIVNPSVNNREVYGIAIDLTRSPNETILGRDGLVNGPRYARQGSEETFQRIPMVPVGIDGPTGWTYGLGETKEGARGFASWGALEGFNARPGTFVEGFILTSFGLPGIRDVQIEPWIDPEQVPENLTEWTQLNAFYEQFTFRTKTVGPKAPPQNFVPIEFLNYLISLLHDSRQLGWIRVDGIHKSLLAKLLEAKRALEKAQNTVARNTLNAFLNEVQAVSCPEVSCPGNKPLTSEAYALLFFNGQFLVERLP